MKKIVLINFFFGKFPWYVDFFLKSCEYNSTVDFLLFTDNKIDGKIPANMKIIPSTLESFNKLATEKIGFEIDIIRPYKFCDFKPCFGVIFQDYIKEYDFWGFCDIDLILGRIREFITDELMNNYNVISVRDDYTSGFFMLFQNTEFVNNIFRKSKDYKKILTSINNYCFDECNYKYMYLNEPRDILKMDCAAESMLEVLVKEQEKGNINVHFDFLVVEGTPGRLKWDRGILTYKNEFEVLLYHFVSYKYNIFSVKPNWDVIPDVFFIDRYNIRKNTQLTNYIKYLGINFIKPFVFNFYQKFDVIISKFFYRKKASILKEGTYFLGETIYTVSNDKDDYNYLKTPYKNSLPVYKLLFNKNYFYVESHPFLYMFHSPDPHKRYSEHFQEIRKDGNTSVFDWRIHTEE
ncbi:DUF6625 family protein [Aquimarina macrocephali]|uniref:DUF6625 family protein n=1 Tax=Aquimarina macrocephali TaxID=666563 RepID=UPI003F66DF85